MPEKLSAAQRRVLVLMCVRHETLVWSYSDTSGYWHLVQDGECPKRSTCLVLRRNRWISATNIQAGRTVFEITETGRNALKEATDA